MNKLTAKLHGKEGEVLKVFSSATAIFDMQNLEDSTAYSPSYTLGEDEWFMLDKFSSLGFSNEIIGDEFSDADLNQVKKDQYSKISYLCSKQGGFFLFQKLFPAQILTKKWFKISDAPTLEVSEPIIVLNNFIDAVYDKNGDKLYFKNIAKIKSIFEGIESLYREATQAEVDSFLSNDFICLKNGYTAGKVKPANRKRIAIVMDTLSKLSKDEKSKLFKYTQSYCKDVTFEKGAFNIDSEDHLKKILYGIEQRYYTTFLSHEKRIASSILKIED